METGPGIRIFGWKAERRPERSGPASSSSYRTRKTGHLTSSNMTIKKLRHADDEN